eukprot:CAMPEP_0184699354 /NCGR_PEP_ID=MMETSP0313-20130426/5655_1 /TAXON_ID=2792 /ORGANISM="Porphyridium aerugineum, Strain SAG 1380-2" /LENGTH=552 /DNA_ID=CAMNT_0027158429 /DNA_START=71 /DNA_END=1726 /DNA_ORIENTATION=-
MDSEAGSRPCVFSSKHEIRGILGTVFEDSDNSSWLLGTEFIAPVPNSSSKDHSVSLEGMTWTDPSHNISIWKDATPRHATNRTLSPRPSMDATNPAFNDGIAKVLTQNTIVDMGTVTWTLQETRGKSALMLVNDSRNPFVFYEPEGVLASNQHRAVGILTEHGYVGAIYYRMSDGRSTLVAFVWTLEPEPNVENHMIMFAPCPALRRPTEDDIIETVVLIDTKDCEFCLARGSSCCSCIGGIRHRPGSGPRSSKQAGRGSVTRDAWLCWKQDCLRMACGLKSFRMVLTNYKRNIVLESIMQYHLRRVTGQVSSSSPHSQIAKRSTDDIPITEANTNISAPSAPTPNHQLGLPFMSDHSNLLPESWIGSLVLASCNNHHNNNSNTRQPLISEANATIAQETSITDQAHANSDSSDVHMNPVTEAHTTSGSNRKEVRLNNAGPPSTSPALNTADSDSRQIAEKMLRDLEQTPWALSHHDHCKLCGLLFSRKHDLKRHIKAMHLDERQFGCECGARFMRKQHLDSHVNTVHLKQANFKCDVCNKIYTAASTLRSH